MNGWALVIDDDPDNRELVTELLALAGYLVVACGGADAAQKILDERGRPGVVVSDVRMPDGDGPALMRSIRSRVGFENTPVIYVTGLAPAGSTAVDDPILVKPFDPDALIGLVAQYCGPPGAAPPDAV
jgi:CheY-like chemotaxis protein